MSDENATEPTQDTVSKSDYEHQVEINRNLQGKLTTLEKEIKRFEGLDLDDYKKTKSELENMKKEAATKGSKEDVENYIKQRETELTSQFNSKYEKDVTERDNQIKALSTKLYELEVVDGAFSKVAPLFVPQFHKFLKDEIRKEIKLEDGQYVVVNEKGERVYKDGTKLLTIDDWAEAKRKEYEPMAVDKTPAGSGTPGEKKAAPTITGLPPNATREQTQEYFTNLHKKKIEESRQKA